MIEKVKEPVTLTPEELAAIDVVAPYEPGKGMSAEEAHRQARKRTEAWMQAAAPTPKA
ncbi:hypothetical protein [Fimbriimonas ginsengisoli]|uniref:Uncharacterized protein n=1 Tax=Fimbriimonas ginsengisoli Gsoil 348 TaxID=661478 RepID=A0A068NQ67_FIMGI|nr:hypothetical protein [Fimbriimonas ginsengisoli]AIE85703.1 hypothetical protein OP10G_2335 [Fimbriimonas ginsengisoli Gsoil 348]